MQLFVRAGLPESRLDPDDILFQASLASFLCWLLARTHDIAADGFYMLALDFHGQVLCGSEYFYGLRLLRRVYWSFFAGFLRNITGNIPAAWSVTFFILGGCF